MNRGVAIASGTWVYFLGAEEALHEENTLARIAAFIEEHPGSDVVYGEMAVASAWSDEADAFDLDRLLFEASIGRRSIFYRRDIFAPDGRSDWDLNIRCFSNPALITRGMDIVVVHNNDFTGIVGNTGQRFIRESAVEIFMRSAAAGRDQDALTVSLVARSYFDLEDFANARHWSARRAEMGGRAEDVYDALYQVAASMANLGAPSPEVQTAYLTAWEFRPTRAEPLHAVARRNREAGRYRLGYLFAKRAAEIPLPAEDGLFAQADVYGWRATDEQAVCASWIGKQVEAFTLWRGLLARPDLPPIERRRIAANRDICVPSMLETARVYPAAVVQSLAAADADVIVTLITGPDRAATENALNSFLTCCTDVTRVGRFLAVDTGLTPEDRAILHERYGFLEFIPGSGAELADLRAQIDAPFWLNLGRGWLFFAPENLITRLIAVLRAEQEVFQVGVNFTDAVTLSGASAEENAVRRAPDAGRYVLTGAPAAGPAMFDTARLDRSAAAGLRTASLDEVLCITPV